MIKVLLTTTSYQDTPGAHHALLESSGFEVVRARGPLTEQEMLDLINADGPFDGFLHGDDQLTQKVIEAALPELKVLAKYGIGLDSVDVAYATEKNLPVLFTPGVNHTTVAEHAIGLMVALSKHFWPHLRAVKAGEWTRISGHELMGKRLAVLGMGRIGKEVIIRARAFGMDCVAHDPFSDEAFAGEHGVTCCDTAMDAMQDADVISLHLPLTDESRNLLNKDSLAKLKQGALVINTARGGLVVEEDIAEACRSGQLGGYGGDVLCTEPMQPGHPFQDIDNIIITPHVGSRTFESVERQAVRATTNLIEYLNGGDDYIQANETTSS
ncbi:MAG: phosphoglycerate dehydrogenase [Woeseiaceae bacterium]